jgi:hypothetical protein
MRSSEPCSCQGARRRTRPGEAGARSGRAWIRFSLAPSGGRATRVCRCAGPRGAGAPRASSRARRRGGRGESLRHQARVCVARRDRARCSDRRRSFTRSRRAVGHAQRSALWRRLPAQDIAAAARHAISRAMLLTNMRSAGGERRGAQGGRAAVRNGARLARDVAVAPLADLARAATPELRDAPPRTRPP